MARSQFKNKQLQSVAARTWKGNNTGSSATPTDNAAGSFSEDTSSILTITGGSNSVLNDILIQVKQASTSQSGYLSSTDWNTFNGKQAALVSATNIKTINGSSVLGSGDLTVSASAAGTSGQVQYNNAGALGGFTVGGDATLDTSTGSLTIANNAVSLAKMAQMATASFLGRNTASTGNVEVLSATTATAILNAMVGDSGSGGTKGLVPAPASGDAAAGKYLKADGTWATVGDDNLILNEIPSGVIDGSNTVFTLANSPTTATLITLFDGINGSGIPLLENTDYTVSGSTITMTTAPASGSTLRAQYGIGNVSPSTPLLSDVNVWSAAQRSTVATLTYGSTVSWNLALTNTLRLVMTGNATLGIPSGIANGTSQSGYINVWQDITGGRTLAYGSGGGNWPYLFQNATPVALAAGKGCYDKLVYSVEYYDSGVVTVSIATPAVVTDTAHGFVTGYRGQFTTTGALPTGLAVNTTYWITVVDANTYKLSSTLANMQAAVFIATSGTQSGTHTFTVAGINLNLGPNNS